MWENWIYGWIKIIDAILIIFSAGYFEPEFALCFECWCRDKNIKRIEAKKALKGLPMSIMNFGNNS